MLKSYLVVVGSAACVPIVSPKGFKRQDAATTMVALLFGVSLPEQNPKSVPKRLHSCSSNHMTQHNPQPELPTAGTATAFGTDCGGDSPSPLVSLDLKCFLICMVGCTTSQRRQRETKRRMLQIAMTFAPKAVKQSNAFGACPKQWSSSKKRSVKEVHERIAPERLSSGLSGQTT